MSTVALLVIALVLFVLLLPPTRRLQLAGWSPRALGAYLGGMLCLGLAVVFLPISARLVVPILILGYLVPLVVARVSLDGVRRAARSGITVGRPPIKTVSGPARDVRGDSRATHDEADDTAEAPADAGRDDRPAGAPREDGADDDRTGGADLSAR